jgi:UDP-glucose 6-dehydrogenase
VRSWRFYSVASDIPSFNSYVELATRRIAAIATSSKIVVEKSTVPCRTAESMRTILEANSKPNCRFDILSNPEFLAEGTAISDLFSPDRVLIGSLQTQEGKDACASLQAVYANWVPYVFIVMPLYMLLTPHLQNEPNFDCWFMVL